MRLMVSNIQHFSVSDGPGIRTTVFLSGCNLRCQWCHNPETWEMGPVTLHFAGGQEEKCGFLMSISEIFEKVSGDLEFYQESGGGITVSGGEPLLQTEEVSELLSCCKKAGIHTLVDTAGALPYERFLPLLPVTDVFYYDIKAADEKRYRVYTGGSFQLVRENLLRLRAEGSEVILRLPLIPGVNTDMKSVETITALAAEAGIMEIHLLPYHRYGISKYNALGMEYPMKNKRLVSQRQMDKIRASYQEAGFLVK